MAVAESVPRHSSIPLPEPPLSRMCQYLVEEGQHTDYIQALSSSSLVWNMYSLLTPIRYVLIRGSTSLARFKARYSTSLPAVAISSAPSSVGDMRTISSRSTFASGVTVKQKTAFAAVCGSWAESFQRACSSMVGVLRRGWAASHYP